MTVTTDEYEVVRYRCTDRDRVFAFLREALSGTDSARLSQQWDWKYDANPFNPDGGPHILLLQARGQLLAMYGRLFFPIVIDGSERLAHHGCDLLVHPAYRGRRLSARLRGRQGFVEGADELIESAKNSLVIPGLFSSGPSDSYKLLNKTAFFIGATTGTYLLKPAIEVKIDD